jgi:PPOX class probable F420-dependent enzyme
MMKHSEVKGFLQQHSHVVVSTLDENRRIQMSLVVATYLDGQLMFTTPSASRKARNAARDPRVTALVLGDTFWQYVTMEGSASLTRLPEAEELLRTVYERIAQKPHPDWAEYDDAMRREDRVVFRITPERMYPLTD